MLETALFILPLCLVVSLVYAASKRDGLWSIVREGLHLFLMTIGGLVVLGIIIYLICRFL